MIWLLTVAVLLCLLFLFLIFPARPDAARKAPFTGRAFAHRGLYELDQSVPENSLTAFRRAAEAGYGAELDVQLSKDGFVLVMHDDDLKRACGKPGGICDYTLEELREFRLFGTEERIPLLEEVLEIFAGHQPLIVELKSAAPNVRELCESTRKMLAGYGGPACVESFHPEVVRFFRKNDPSRLRGQLSQSFRLWRGAVPAPEGFALSRLLLNFRARPHFVAYGLDAPKPVPVRLCERLGAMKVCWTAREENLHAQRMQEYDTVIFEGYRPSPKG